MKDIYKTIWKAALPHQDARDDTGHAQIVTQFAQQLCELVGADDRIVVPAAMLHDIGWSQIPSKK